MDVKGRVVTKDRDARKVSALIQKRARALRAKLAQQQQELTSVDLEIGAVREVIKSLHGRLAKVTPPRVYARHELMRERGSQAVARYEIACREAEEGNLLERRKDLEQERQRSRMDVLALDKRQKRHGEWFARRALHRNMLREMETDADITEGNYRGASNQK